MIAKVTIPERKIEKIRIGADVRITLTAIPDSRYLYFDGKLTKLSTSAKNGEFLGTIEIDDNQVQNRIPSIEILLGTTVNGRIKLGRSTLFEKIRRVFGS